VNRDVLEAFRAGELDWQTRMNDALRMTLAPVYRRQIKLRPYCRAPSPRSSGLLKPAPVPGEAWASARRGEHDRHGHTANEHGRSDGGIPPRLAVEPGGC
jgi:hypothetical protein